MKILVCGAAAYRDGRRIVEALDILHAATGIECIVHDGESHVARLADDWAYRRGVRRDPYPAKWDDLRHPQARRRWNPSRRRFYDAAAGGRRDLQMLIEGAPQLVVAFPGDANTDSLVAKALRRDTAVLSVDP